MGNRISTSAKKLFRRESTEVTPVKGISVDDREILENEKKTLNLLEEKVESLQNKFENAIHIDDDASDVDQSELEGQTKDRREFSNVKNQVYDLEEKFEEYNTQIHQNSDRYDRLLNSVSKLEGRMNKLTKKIKKINEEKVPLKSNVSENSKKIKKPELVDPKSSVSKKSKASVAKNETKRRLEFGGSSHEKENDAVMGTVIEEEDLETVY